MESSERGVGATPETQIKDRGSIALARRQVQVAAAPAAPVDTALIEPAPAALRAPKPVPSPQVLRNRQIAADVVAVVAGLVCALVIVGAFDASEPTPYVVPGALLAGVAWMASIGMNRLYLARAVARPAEEFQRFAASGLAASGLTLIVDNVFNLGLPSDWALTSFLTVMGFLCVERLLARRAFTRMRASGQLRRRVAIVGTDVNAQELHALIDERPELGYDVVGYIATAAVSHAPEHGPVIGHAAQAADVLRSFDCGGVVVSTASVNAVHVNRFARELTDAGFHVALSTGLRDFDEVRLRPQSIGTQTLVYLEPTIRDGWRSHAKRAFDLVLASIGLLFSVPIVAVAAIAIRLDSKGPIFFRQERVGRDGRPFEMIKLRTMTADAEARQAAIIDQNESDGPLFKMANDPRITRVGRILRRTSIDELPQFWNVLRGDMSVVGPRPALAKEVAEWDEQLLDRLRVLPGVTGMWQVSGRSSTTFAEYRRLDLYYVDNWSLFHDIKIVLKTFAVVVLQRGAS